MKGKNYFNQKKSLEFYEVFRVSKRHELTINLICRLKYIEGEDESLDCKKPKFIWERRSNLTGVHFKVGVNSQVSLLAKDNKVNGIFLNIRL
jgi:hypothetical protein